MMKFLIAGLGSIGRRHLRNLRALGEEDILLFRTHHATLPDDDLAGLPTFTDLGEALAEKPDAAIICNPSAAHLGVALPAAAAGCHLMIEKPVSHKLEGLPELRQELALHHKQALVGFHFRHHPVLQQVKSILASSQLGLPLSAQAHWGEYLPDWHPWEDYRLSYAAQPSLGGGVVLTLSHPLDYLRWLLGETQVLSATTAHISDLEIEVEDSAEITLLFESGARAQVHLDYYQRPPAHWLEVTCSAGFVRWNNASGSAEIYTTADKKWQRLDPPADFERNSLFLAEMAHFVQVCRGAEAPICSLEDGIRALATALAVHTSAAQAGRLVPIQPV